MGLDCTHDAFHGAYSAFNRLRQKVAKAAGGSFPFHDVETIEAYRKAHGEELNQDHWFVGKEYSQETHPGLWEFLIHSDCDGEIEPGMCAKVADDLEALLPKIADELGGGHIEGQGGYRAVLRKFIKGCREAHAAGEPLEFG